jgi:SAM-dependent methyltransferase
VNTQATQAQIDAALTYERLFVPAEFQEWAARVSDALDIRPGARVLDVACGTGVLARTIAARIGEDGFVAGVDTDPGMLTVASRLAPNVDFRLGVAEALPWPDASFDAVASQFGLMFFSNRERALREMQRVCRPGGRIVVAVWGRLEDTPAYAQLVEILERVAGAGAAAPLRAPFNLGERDVLASVLAAAGLAGARIETYDGHSRFPHIRTLVEADLRGWLPVMGVMLRDDQIEQVVARAEQALQAYLTPDGQVSFLSPAHVVTATRRA